MPARGSHALAEGKGQGAGPARADGLKRPKPLTCGPASPADCGGCSGRKLAFRPRASRKRGGAEVRVPRGRAEAGLQGRRRPAPCPTVSCFPLRRRAEAVDFFRGCKARWREEKGAVRTCQRETPAEAHFNEDKRILLWIIGSLCKSRGFDFRLSVMFAKFHLSRVNLGYCLPYYSTSLTERKLLTKLPY